MFMRRHLSPRFVPMDMSVCHVVLCHFFVTPKTFCNPKAQTENACNMQVKIIEDDGKNDDGDDDDEFQS